MFPDLDDEQMLVCFEESVRI